MTMIAGGPDTAAGRMIGVLMGADLQMRNLKTDSAVVPLADLMAVMEELSAARESLAKVRGLALTGSGMHVAIYSGDIFTALGYKS